MFGVVTTVALMVNIFSIGYMKGEPRYFWFFAVLQLFAASMLMLVMADNLLLLYIAWELVGACSFFLIGFYWEKRSAVEASKKAFITTRIGDVGLLIGILILWKATGTFNIQEIIHAAEEGHISGQSLFLGSLGIFIGCMGKSAQVPFHVWLPDAMEGPTPVSALIHAATMVVAGVYLTARMLPVFEVAEGMLLIITHRWSRQRRCSLASSPSPRRTSRRCSPTRRSASSASCSSPSARANQASRCSTS